MAKFFVVKIIITKELKKKTGKNITSQKLVQSNPSKVYAITKIQLKNFQIGFD